MSIVLDGTSGITSPGGDTATVSVATPIVKSPSSLTLQTNGSTTAVTIDTAQNVGIGVTPSAWGGSFKALQLGGTGAVWFPPTGTGSVFISNNTYYDGSAFKYINTGASSYLALSSDSTLVFNQAPSGTAGSSISYVNSFRMDAAGAAKFISTIGVGNATPSASGAGITFPATQSASSDANTLDDYEEGTWTPTLSGWSGTYSTQSGRYTKIGRQVTLIGSVITNASTGTFAAYPGPAGYPFAGGTGGSAVYGTWAVFSGSQNLGTTIIAGGVLDGPSGGATDSFPNVFVAGGNTGNFGATYLNAAASVTYRFQVIYFV